MFEELRGILSGVGAEYADLRHEVRREVTIVFNGRELSQVSSNSGDGYVLRALSDGGMSSVVFTKAEDAGRAARTVVENARLLGRHVAKPVRLAEVETAKDSFFPPLGEDPREVPIEEKLELLRAYNDIPLSQEGIATTTSTYREVIREKRFLSTEGAEVREDLVTVGVAGNIVAKDGDVTQDVRVYGGGSDGFQNVRGEEANFEARTKLALDLLKARPVKAGTYDCVVNPRLAGVFTHEAFGHFSEADIIESLPAMRAKMELGARLGSAVVNIVDDATQPGQLGFYKYDDEGVAVRRTQLMKEGVLTGRLHSRRTAAEFGEPVTGHHIAEDYRYAPIVRMGNIYMEPGEATFEELIERLGEGLYVVDVKGGQTSGENFSFGAQHGFLVRGGKVREMVRDLNVSGNLYRTLRDIEAVGNDLSLSRIGGCGKGQLNIRSTNGGPHALIRNLVVGGA